MDRSAPLSLLVNVDLRTLRQIRHSMRTYVRDGGGSCSCAVPPSDRAASTLDGRGRRARAPEPAARGCATARAPLCRPGLAEVREGGAAVARAIPGRGGHRGFSTSLRSQRVSPKASPELARPAPPVPSGHRLDRGGHDVESSGGALERAARSRWCSGCRAGSRWICWRGRRGSRPGGSPAGARSSSRLAVSASGGAPPELFPRTRAHA
jgi:hypothetical protein